MGEGGRAIGMGGAYTALATDSLATYWNPAGLAGGTAFNRGTARENRPGIVGTYQPGSAGNSDKTIKKVGFLKQPSLDF